MESKHSAYDLAQMQSLPLSAKIRMSKERIRQWYDHYNGEVYVSFSGGKDSTVLKHMVDSMYSDVPSVFVNTGLEYPELQRFVKNIKEGKYDCFNSDVEIIRPEKRFDEVIKKIGYPVISKRTAQYLYYGRTHFEEGRTTSYTKLLDGTSTMKNGEKSFYSCEKWKPLIHAPFKVSHKCCGIMKKDPMKKYGKRTGRTPIIGTMADESMGRKDRWMKYGCNSFSEKNPSSQPMSFWTENDVLEYIRTFNVPYTSVYGDIVETGKVIHQILEDVPELKTTGCDRTGCMFCLFGCHLHNDQRFVNMKETHPNQYNYCMKPIDEGGLGIKDVIDWMNENIGTNIQY